MKGDELMTDKNDFDMYSNYDDKIPMRKKDTKAVRPNKEEFGMEHNSEKNQSNQKEPFGDWVDRMTKELEN